MTLFVLDTNIVSVLAPGRDALVGEQSVTAWLREREPQCRLSVLTIMEIESGIQQLVLRGATRKGPELRQWLTKLQALFGDRILPIDQAVAAQAGVLEAAALSKGRHPGLADLLIGATATAHGMTLLTRNLRHFLPLGVTAADPFTLKDGK